MSSAKKSALGRFATRNAVSIGFIAFALCLAGVFSALNTPSSVFPATPFPRIVVMVGNGIMPAKEMMATITRPIEESMKSIPGVVSVRSSTTRGSAIVNVIFGWGSNMEQAELYVMGHLSDIRSDLPPTATTDVSRVAFSLSYPIIGISLTSSTRTQMDLWNTATYTIKPLFLKIPGVAKVELLGGHAPEYHVVVDPLKLQAAHLSLQDVSDALTKNNLVAAAGMLVENYHLYLTTVDGRVHSADDIGNAVIAVRGTHPILVKDVARVVVGPEPGYTVVTAQGRQAVLFNIESQPDSSVLRIASDLKAQLRSLKSQLPPDMHLAFFYDQSQFVRDSVGSVWDAIVFGLILSFLILFLFLKNWGSVLTAIVTIPITVLITLVAMHLTHMSFNMMTLGGIAAAIGLVIDDAIVVVESIYTKIAAGRPRLDGIQEGVGEILHALVGSTLTPVVVFLPLAYLNGMAGVFFRALGLTMTVALLVSLALAVTLTPSLAGWFIRPPKAAGVASHNEEGGFLFRRILHVYEFAVRRALRHRWLTFVACVGVLVAGVFVYRQLESNFMPDFDEGGFVMDYTALPGTSLAETSRVLDQAEKLIRANPDVESYSRRLGTQLGPFITEPYVGDYLIKLKANRTHTTEQVLAAMRHQFNERFPSIRWDFHGFLDDLIGDLQMAPDPIEIKLYSPDMNWLQKTARRVEKQIQKIPGVVDTFDGLTVSGPSINLRVRPADAERYGLTVQDIADTVNTALLGQVSSHVLQGDRVVNIRVLADPKSVSTVAQLKELPLRTRSGVIVRLDQVADVQLQADEVELNREDLRQYDIVSARLEGRDLGSAMKQIKATLANDAWLPPGSVEYGGLYRLQQESFRNLVAVLGAALLLVFTVLLIEFRSFRESFAIVFGAILALFGTVAALWLTGISLNIVSFLGAIIGVGIVAKNGILVLDYNQQLLDQGLDPIEALVQSGLRRLRPVLMTSLAAALGMLPLAWGVGTGAQMLQPLGVSVIGALVISVLLSLIATPTVYSILKGAQSRAPRAASQPGR
ncbi:cobalt-zinc-cadmium resistance protein CzcA [mine drainage metagenome]|uniref:Cobalt-zinc-cadmium resistance protein CzcA n=1 Tax=mine drainage metagenome TaxID=410659 RepID=A0A1J5S6X6_9ZZZZ